MLDPAQKIIDIFGGCTALGKAIGRHRTTVWRWAQPKSDKTNRGGGGFIPAEDQANILRAAKKIGVKLRPEDVIKYD